MNKFTSYTLWIHCGISLYQRPIYIKKRRKKPFFPIGIHFMQGWTATTRHGVTRKEAQKKITGYRKSV